jgi:hypothetical protein
MRWHLIMMFGCTPAATPAPELPPPDVPPSTWVRRLSDIEVHPDRITFIDLEIPPQRISPYVPFNIPDSETNTHVIGSLRPGFRSCFNRGLRSDPSMQGKVVFAARIAPDGKPSSVEIVSRDGLSEEVAACMKRKLEAAQFEPIEGMDGGGTTLKIPITFLQQAPQITAAKIPSAPAAWLDFDALRACNVAAQKKGALIATNATFTVDDGDGGFDVRVDPFEGDQELLACAGGVVARIERGSAPRPFAFRILFVP